MEGYRNSLACLHILLKYFHVGSMQGYAIPWLAEDILLHISMWATSVSYTHLTLPTKA